MFSFHCDVYRIERLRIVLLVWIFLPCWGYHRFGFVLRKREGFSGCKGKNRKPKCIILVPGDGLANVTVSRSAAGRDKFVSAKRFPHRKFTARSEKNGNDDVFCKCPHMDVDFWDENNTDHIL